MSRAELLVLPVPQQARLTGGYWKVAEPLGLAGLETTSHGVRDTILRELAPARLVGPDRANVRFFPARTAPSFLAGRSRQPQGYGLIVARDGVRIWAGDDAGRLYAAITLSQLRRRFGNRLPGMWISDAPRLAHRGVQIPLAQGHTEYRPAYMRHLVRELARWKINALYLYLESFFEFPSLPHCAGPGAMTPAEARELQAWCRSHGMTLIPMLNLLGHAQEILYQQRYRHLAEYGPGMDPRTAGGSNYCPSSPEARRLCALMLNDMLDIFESEIIHCGGDEVALLGACPRCAAGRRRAEPPAFYVRHFARLRDLAVRRGRRIGLWGDMLLHYGQRASARERARWWAPLRQGTVIYDWHYTGGSPETVRLFTREGFATVACTSSNTWVSASLWPGQATGQRLLFGDAVRYGAWGGLTTAWGNQLGFHEEHANYLFASGATALWSGPTADALAPGLSLERFERAYNLQRYGWRSGLLTKYWHTLGDAQGPVCRVLAPFNGLSLRKCLYQTDNVLTFWLRYAYNLRGRRLGTYRAGLRRARALWEATRRLPCDDPYLPLQEGPLLMHEHLLRRFEMTEVLYDLYDRAAQAQFRDPGRFRTLMRRAAATLRGHLRDFLPLERYLHAAHRGLGLRLNALAWLQATQRNIRRLADFLEYLASSERPLPLFAELHNMFLQQARSAFPGIREHEWNTGPARFRRYVQENGFVWNDGPSPAFEPGPHVPVQTFWVSKLMPILGTVADVRYPRPADRYGFRRRNFPALTAAVHFDLFPNGESGVVFYRTKFRCPEPMALELVLGYDGPVKVWVNRQPVFTDLQGVNPTWPEKACVPFAAHRGTHEIVVALSSNSGRAYEICLLLRRRDVGGRVRDVALPEVIV